MAVYIVFVALLATVIVSAIIATTRRPLDSCHRALKARPHSALPLQLGSSACMAIMGNKRIMRAHRTKNFKRRMEKGKKTHIQETKSKSYFSYQRNSRYFIRICDFPSSKETSSHTAVSVFAIRQKKKSRKFKLKKSTKPDFIFRHLFTCHFCSFAIDMEQKSKR